MYVWNRDVRRQHEILSLMTKQLKQQRTHRCNQELVSHPEKIWLLNVNQYHYLEMLISIINADIINFAF